MPNQRKREHDALWASMAIMNQDGTIPVIFFTGTPGAYEPCDPSAMILSKPINEEAIIATSHKLAPL